VKPTISLNLSPCWTECRRRFRNEADGRDSQRHDDAVHLRWMKIVRAVALLVGMFLCVGELKAHEVLWWEYLFTFDASTPMFLTSGPDVFDDYDSSEIGILPSAEEPCIVVVNLNPVTTSAISTHFIRGNNVGNEVYIEVDVEPGATSVDTTVSGEWHATGFPLNNFCNATNPNPFSVPISVRRPTPWAITPVNEYGISLDTGGKNVGLQAADTPSGPWYNIGKGSNFYIMPIPNAQFYRENHKLGGSVKGTVTDGSGNPQSGVTLGLPLGGVSAIAGLDGSFALNYLAWGTNLIAAMKSITFVDSSTGSNRTEAVGLNIEVPTVTLYGALSFKAEIHIVPIPACNCTPWCAIGVGSLNGVQTPVYYSGGVLPPKNAPANCGQPQVTVTPPSGVSYPIVAGGGKHQNSGPNPAAGTWTVTVTVCGQSKQCTITVP